MVIFICYYYPLLLLSIILIIIIAIAIIIIIIVIIIIIIVIIIIATMFMCDDEYDTDAICRWLVVCLTLRLQKRSKESPKILGREILI